MICCRVACASRAMALCIPTSEYTQESGSPILSFFIRGGESRMTMKLYSWDISPYAARVRMQIYAKGLTDIATEQTTFYLTQKVYEERLLSRIPSLEVDGDALPESAVIAEYLEEAYPEPSLLGSTPR